MRPRFMSFLAVAAALLAAADVHARSYILVAPPNAALPANLQSAVARAGGTITQALPQIGIVVVESSRQSFAAEAQRISGISSVLPDVMWQTKLPIVIEGETVTDDAAAEAGLTVPDARFPIQWGHTAINALGAWEAGQFGAGVLVAVLDSGIAATHIDLAANVDTLLSKSFVVPCYGAGEVERKNALPPPVYPAWGRPAAVRLAGVTAFGGRFPAPSGERGKGREGAEVRGPRLNDVPRLERAGAFSPAIHPAIQARRPTSGTAALR